VRSVFVRLLMTTAVAGVAVRLPTSVVAVPLAAFPVPVHGDSGLFLRDQVPRLRPQLAGDHRPLVQLRRTSEEQPGVEP
jgi:hypothetical protein